LAAERPLKKAAKVAITTEQRLIKEKVTRRALVGMAAMAFVGYVLHQTHNHSFSTILLTPNSGALNYLM
jgi:hypothetical protein